VLLTFSDLPWATGALRAYYASRVRGEEAEQQHAEPRPWALGAKSGDELFWLDTNVTLGARLWEDRGTYLELSLRGGSLADVAHVIGKLDPVPRLLGDATETSAGYVDRPTRVVRVLVHHHGDTLVRVTAHFQHPDGGVMGPIAGARLRALVDAALKVPGWPPQASAAERALLVRATPAMCCYYLGESGEVYELDLDRAAGTLERVTDAGQIRETLIEAARAHPELDDLVVDLDTKLPP
jgi:hypothetical protein